MIDLILFDDGTGEAIFAGGLFSRSDSQVVNNIAKWNTRQWLPLGAGTNDIVRTMAVFDDGGGEALYAAGDFSIAGGVLAAHIARWNGATWSPVGDGLNGSVYALAVHDDGNGAALYAGGDFTQSGATTIDRIAKWNGTQWQPLPGGGADDRVRSLLSYSDSVNGGLYAGGLFDTIGGINANSIARWDGAQWHGLGSGVDHAIRSMLPVVENGVPAIFMGGIFTTAGGAPANRVARWDFSMWSQVGSSAMNNDVDALGVFMQSGAPAIFAGGNFTTADGNAADQIAAWDGSTWQPVQTGAGSGTFDATRVLDFLVFDDGVSGGPALYVSGRGVEISNQLAGCVVRYGCERIEACCMGDGTCVPDTLISDCVALGGLPLGPGTSCSTDTCPLPEACCFGDGSCQFIPSTFCESLGGLPLGTGTDCVVNTCSQPQACCFDDGSCTDLIPTACAAAGGNPAGEGTDCASFSCPFQACCFVDASCLNLTEDACIAQNGTPQGDGTDCTTYQCPTEACCLPDGRCEDLTAAACLAEGGAPQGPGTDCPSPACLTEACCFTDGVCTDLTPVSCTNQGGTPLGPGTSCGLSPCPTRACCLPSGECITLADGTVCDDLGGVLADVGISCDDLPCPQFEACCFGTTCVELLPSECTAGGGLPQGLGSTCPDSDCPDAGLNIQLSDIVKFPNAPGARSNLILTTEGGSDVTGIATGTHRVGQDGSGQFLRPIITFDLADLLVIADGRQILSGRLSFAVTNEMAETGESFNSEVRMFASQDLLLDAPTQSSFAQLSADGGPNLAVGMLSLNDGALDPQTVEFSTQTLESLRVLLLNNQNNGSLAFAFREFASDDDDIFQFGRPSGNVTLTLETFAGPPVACCLPDGRCVDAAAAQICTNVGGTPHEGFSCGEFACLGDFDGDGDVDLSDFAKWMLCYGGASNPPSSQCPLGVDADFDNDGDVDLSDFAIFTNAYTGPR